MKLVCFGRCDNCKQMKNYCSPWGCDNIKVWLCRKCVRILKKLQKTGV